MNQLELEFESRRFKKIEIPKEIIVKMTGPTGPGTKKGGRKKGTKNYNHDETMSLLRTLEDVLPVCGEEWEAAVQRHFNNYPVKNRDAASIKDKLFKLTKKKGGTGNPNMPEDVKLARQVYKQILLKTDLGTADESFDVEEGYRVLHNGDPNGFNNDLMESSDDDDDDDENVPKAATQVTVQAATNGDSTTMPFEKSMTVPGSLSLSNRSAVTPNSKRNYTSHFQTQEKTLQTVQAGIDRDQARWERQMQLWDKEKAEERQRREEDRKERMEREDKRERREARQHKEMLAMMMAALSGGKRNFSTMSDSDDIDN